MLDEKIKEVVEKQRNYFATGNTLDYTFRKDKLIKLKAVIKKYEEQIFEALKKDLGKHEFESYATEISVVYSEINHALKHLKKWMKTKKVPTPIASFGGVSKIYKQHLGVVLIMSPWNYPFQLSIAPLVAAAAAGNCVVIKPSSYSPNTSSLIEKMISETFEEKYICVFQGNREINQMLLDEKFDHIFFTGSVKVGKIVMESAAQKLTPVTLELGGKSPCIVNKDADLKKAAARIIWGKTVNCGQTCIAPDYVLVHEDVKEKLVAEMIKAKKKYFGEDMLASADYGKIIRPQAFDGLLALMDNQKKLDGGKYNAITQKIELTLLDNPSLDSPIMQREIFGPILPIISVESIDDAFDIIFKYARPLALYLFTKDKSLQQFAVERVHFGGGCINDTVMHIANGNMPFGGVGDSGMGKYHGEEGFATFTHTKSVLKQNFLFDVPLRYAPYKKKLNLVRKILK